MSLRQLEYMLKVAEEQSFTKASLKLKIAQPSLSQYILNLEQNLGVILFNRTTNPITLTHAGEVFSVKAQEILRLNRELTMQMQDIAGLKKGKLKLGVSQTGADFIPKVLSSFNQKFPDVEIELIEAYSSREMEKILQDNVIDIGTLILPIEADNMSYDVIQEERFLIALPINHPLVGQMKKRPNEAYPEISLHLLKNEQFVLPKASLRIRLIFDKVFHEAGFVPNILCQTQTMDVANTIVASGMGVCFSLPQNIRVGIKDKLALFSISNSLVVRTLVLAHKKEKYLPEIALEFLAIAKKYTK